MRTTLCVLFDVDDTLYDHTYASQAALRAVTQHEPGIANAGFKSLLTANMKILEALHPAVIARQMTLEAARSERFRQLLARFGGDPARADALAAGFHEAYEQHERLVPGVELLLPRLRMFGVRMGIVSNNSLARQTGKLQRLGIGGLFDDLVVSDEHGVAKPDPRLFEVALKRIGIAAPDSVHVGDRWDLDVVGARSAGVVPVWFNRFGLEPLAGATPAPAPVAQLDSFQDPGRAIGVILDYGLQVSPDQATARFLK